MSGSGGPDSTSSIPLFKQFFLENCLDLNQRLCKRVSLLWILTESFTNLFEFASESGRDVGPGLAAVAVVLHHGPGGRGSTPRGGGGCSRDGEGLRGVRRRPREASPCGHGVWSVRPRLWAGGARPRENKGRGAVAPRGGKGCRLETNIPPPGGEGGAPGVGLFGPGIRLQSLQPQSSVFYLLQWTKLNCETQDDSAIQLSPSKIHVRIKQAWLYLWKLVCWAELQDGEYNPLTRFHTVAFPAPDHKSVPVLLSLDISFWCGLHHPGGLEGM